MKFVKPLLSGILLILVFTSAVLISGNDLPKVLEKLRVYNLYRPQQKIYIHFDRPLYASGEDVWFNTYLLDASSNRPDSLSRIIYVELFDSDKALIRRLALYAPNGIARGDFHLPDSLHGGNYLVRAYTNYMKNSDQDFFFSKEIAVLNENDSLQGGMAKVESLPDVQFFPEGGNFVAGVENNIAFKSSDQQGRSIEVEGEIVDENNAPITSFKSEHMGMGSFRISPIYGKQYKAILKNSKSVFTLPEVTQKDYLLRIMETATTIKVIAYSDMKQYSDAPCRLSIVAQSSGVARFAVEGEILKSTLIVNIPKSKLPSGITQITLFDGVGIPQCERLVFINHQNTINLSIRTDRDEYTKNKKVELDISAKTITGIPASGYFSLSVYDESKIQDVEEYPISINSYLLLTSDLKGRVEEPGYYLKDTLFQTKRDADLLMLTHGWRRFTWKTILSDTLPPLNYYPENGIVMSGKLLKSITKKPAKDSEVKILSSGQGVLVLKTDSLGRFYNDEFLYYDSAEFFIQTDNAKGKQSDMILKLDPFNVSPTLQQKPSALASWNAREFLDQTDMINKIAQGYKSDKDATVLKGVEVKAKKEEPVSTNKLYGVADATIKMKDMPQNYTNILQVLQGRVAGVNVVGNSISIRGGGEPLFLLDGMQMDFNSISNIPMNDVESIDVLKGVSASIYGGRGGNGVIAIYTKRGGGYSSRPTIGAHTIKYPGLYRAREFYSPKYEVPRADNTIPDIRNTLYWNPSIVTSHDGNVHVSFFTSDNSAKYRIVIEGISREGIPGTGSQSFIVK